MRRPRRGLLPLSMSSLLVLLPLLLPPSALATQVLPRTPEQLGQEAALVVQGRVLSTRSYWNEAHTRILTETEVQVERPFKGKGPEVVRVVQMGGVVDGVRMTVSGALAWMPGEEVLLFLSPSLPGRYRVEGFTQGKFQIERDRQTGRLYARGSTIGGGGQSPTMRLPLEDLVARALQQDGGR